ncbi:MAG: hypothetical protein WCJ29_04490 [bacterium]
MSKPLILIDWYRTLSEHKFWENHVSESALGIIQSELKNNLVFLNDWMRAKTSSEDVCEILSAETQLSSKELFSALQKSCEDISLSTAMVSALSEVSRKADLVLVSDNMDCFERWTLPNLKKLGVFSGFYLSSAIKRLKNDNGGLTLAEACRAYNINPQEASLIDDSKPTRDIFESLGGRAHEVSNPADTERTLKELLKSL